MNMQTNIETKLAEALSPQHLQVINESHQHSVPAHSETHFKVVIVSEDFVGMRKLARHRCLYQLLAEELAGPLHALALHTYTRAEWEARPGAAPLSPPCLGGSKAEQSRL